MLCASPPSLRSMHVLGVSFPRIPSVPTLITFLICSSFHLFIPPNVRSFYLDPVLGSHMYIDDSRDDSSSRGTPLQDRIVHKIKMWIFLFLLFLNHNPCMGAAPTSTKTPPPYISLTDNLNEPKNVGWCLDLQGWGKSIKFTDMQVHSCKDSGGDVNFFPAASFAGGSWTGFLCFVVTRFTNTRRRKGYVHSCSCEGRLQQGRVCR